MRLADCEVTHRHIRGHNVAFLFGPHAISDDEANALAQEWRDSYGPIALPGYFSPETGWRSLVPGRLVGRIEAAIKVDEMAEVIEFEGVKFSAELLRAFQAPTPEGHAFRVVTSKDGVATVARVDMPATKPAPARSPKAPPAQPLAADEPPPPLGPAAGSADVRTPETSGEA